LKYSIVVDHSWAVWSQNQSKLHFYLEVDMSSDLMDALTVALIVTVFSCLMSPALVWLFTSHQQG
jgi:hypothetical protein